MTDRNTIERGNEKFFENVYINDAIKTYAFNGAILGNIIIIKTGKIYLYMWKIMIFISKREWLLSKKKKFS